MSKAPASRAIAVIAGRNSLWAGCAVKGRSLARAAVFRDVQDFVLEDEKIGACLSCQADHVPVVILNPAVHHFSIGQLDADSLLLFAQRFQISRFFRSLIRWRRLPFTHGIR